MIYFTPLSYSTDPDELNRPARSCKNCKYAIRIKESIPNNRQKKQLKHPKTFRVQEYVRCMMVKQLMSLDENEDRPVVVNVWFAGICPFFEYIG